MKASLASTHPDLAEEWHLTRNGEVLASDVAPGSDKVYWWLGKCGHEWDMSVGNRTRGQNCPICRNVRIVAGINDLSTLRPDLTREWNHEKNSERTLRKGHKLSPETVGVGSSQKVWWLGKCGHEWEASVDSRARGSGCSFCVGGRVLQGVNDLKTLRPDIADFWDYEANGELAPSMIRAGSSKKVYWLCPVGHSFLASVQGRASGRGCGVCRNLDIRPGVNDLATLRPDIASQWDYEKNRQLATRRKAPLTPQTVGPNSAIKVWWLCQFGHSYDSLIDTRCVRATGCRICAGRELKVGFNDLASRHPELAKEFHPTRNGDILPSQILAGQPKDYWWLGKCGHEWEARLTNRASRDSGCPECSTTGYKSSLPGLLYFIENETLGSFKIGITNPSAKNDRLKGFKNEGWTVHFTINDEDGRLILRLETLLLSWIRKDLKLPIHLAKRSVKSMRGSSETFANGLVETVTVIKAIKLNYKILKAKSD